MNINESKSPASENSVWVFEIGQLRDRVAELEAEGDAARVQIERLSGIHNSDCDALNINPDGIVKPCNCEAGRDFVPRAVADKLAAACSMMEKWMEMDNFDDEEIEKLTLQTVGEEVESALAEYRKAIQ